MECTTARTRSANTMTAIKGVLYDNCYLQDPQGNVLCLCNNKKLDWYLERNLGVEVSQSPRTVNLNFQPKHFDRDNDSMYYTIEKENKCVVCGSTGSLVRKNVVPVEYRSHLPKEMKFHKSHDVVLLCLNCHHESVLRDQKLRNELIVKCSAPITQINLTEEARTLNKLKLTANVLLKKNLPISQDRKRELRNIICEYENCNDDEITDEFLMKIKLRKIETKPTTKSHGEKVVEYYQDNAMLNEFQIMWRSHFVETMKPQHLPKLWSVFHNSQPSTYHVDENKKLVRE